MSRAPTDVSSKSILRKRTDEEKISTNFTIFKDQTATSNFEERRLLALIPSYRLQFALEFREEDKLSTQEEQQSEIPRLLEKNQTRETDPEKDQIQQTATGRPVDWRAGIDDWDWDGENARRNRTVDYMDNHFPSSDVNTRLPDTGLLNLMNDSTEGLSEVTNYSGEVGRVSSGSFRLMRSPSSMDIEKLIPKSFYEGSNTMTTEESNYDEQIKPEVGKLVDKIDIKDLESEDKTMRKMIKMIEALQKENRELITSRRNLLEAKVQEAKLQEESPTPPIPTAQRWETLYRFSDSTYLAEPSWIRPDSGRMILTGNLPLLDLSSYLRRHEDIAFIVYKGYDKINSLSAEELDRSDTIPLPRPTSESLKLVSQEMKEALRMFTKRIPDFALQFPDFDFARELKSPFLFWYYCRAYLDPILPTLSENNRNLVEMLSLWIEANRGSEYKKIDTQLSEGFVTAESMKYLVKAGDVLVSNTNGVLSAHMTKSWAKEQPETSKVLETLRAIEKVGKLDTIAESNRSSSVLWHVETWSWVFDGKFKKKNNVVEIKTSVTRPDDKVRISDLNMFPLKYASAKMQQTLQNRGRIFWSCRRKRMVSYVSDMPNDSSTSSGERFMVDVSTYQQYTRKKKQGNDWAAQTVGESEPADEDITPEVMANDTFPEGPMLLLFPAKITGYDLRRKTWVDLEVDRLCDVSWNKKAFETLVVDDDTKELIEALVTSQLAAEKSTDMVAGKGNGLIILLHGGPGTGKTFTAEGVADFAEKPLYRVTCGDIGTKPEEVENVREQAFHILRVYTDLFSTWSQSFILGKFGTALYSLMKQTFF
ncbi:hypothetical protein ACMFMF_000179 [Clarireedia jacksonii]